MELVGSSHRHRRLVMVLGLLAALLATSACGARWSDDERAAVLARNSGGGAAAAGDDGGSGAADGVTGSTVPGSTSGGTTGGTGGGTGGGTTGGAGGGTDGATAGPSGPKPCAAASDAPGVTDDTINVGHISSVSGPVPGLGESTVAASRAYVAYRNATGGICGRQVVLKTADDGAENARYRAAVSELGPQVLGFAGGLGAGDGGSVDVVKAQQIPIVATPTQDSFQALPTVFDTNPPFANVHAKIGKMQYLWDQGVRTAALVYIDQPQVKSQVEQQRAQMEAVGIRVVYENAVPLSTLSYDAAARGVANSKADYLFYPAAGNLNASMARSMKDSGYQPKFAEYLTADGSNFIELAGDAAEGAVSWTRALPVEEAGSNAELDTFLEWMGRAAPGVPADAFAADAWAGSKAFFDAIEALPGPISRDALLAQLRSVETFDAGGFFGPIQLGKKLSNACAILMKVVSGKWQRVTPARGFLC
jgi:ABC-type branched-subunit amino acid transport system substrate-binding protein